MHRWSLFVLLLATSVGQADQGEYRNQPVEVVFDQPGQRVWLLERDFELDDLWTDRARLYVNPLDLEELRGAGLRVIELEEPHPTAFDPVLAGDLVRFPYVQPKYHDYPELKAALESLAEAHPAMAILSSLGKTEEGRDMLALRLGRPSSEPRPEVLLIGGLHGNEVVGNELLLGLARYLLATYATEARSRKVLDQLSIVIVPSANPDGTARRWRSNGKGIDLNRDFLDPRRAHPREAFRALESRNVARLAERRRFLLSAVFHGGEIVVNYPWDHRPNTGNLRPEDAEVLRRLSLRYAGRNEDMAHNPRFPGGVTSGYEWYQIRGGLQDYFYGWYGSLNLTIEVSRTKWPVPAELPVVI